RQTENTGINTLGIMRKMDSRVRGWLLLDSYLPTLSFTIVYLLIVYLGPKYTRNRPSYSLKGVLLVYNFSVSMLSLYMLVEVSCSKTNRYRLQCLGLHEAGEADVRVAKVLWWYYFSKLIEFLDTMFFVLRKKNSQITFLQVYHHASMFNIWWSVLNWIWIPVDRVGFFGPTLNSFIHKRYLTQAQLVQFLLSIIHTLGAVIVPCGFPIRRLLIQVSYMATLAILFVNVYIQLTFEQSHIKSSHSNGHSASTNDPDGKITTPTTTRIYLCSDTTISLQLSIFVSNTCFGFLDA
uniref:Elongation of very long chain fatty acids protein n=1 Tax=Oncorhynchus tshawytscha TaxID=74940 RepID=A0A8C8K5Z0_ONCTS